MAQIVAILFATLAAVTQGAKTHFTVYENGNCAGGTIGDITATENKYRELRWSDSQAMTWAVDTSSGADSQCNTIDCRVPGGTSCGMSDWSMTFECGVDDGATVFQINTFKKSDCSQQIAFYLLTSAEFQKLGAGTCAKAEAWSTWGSCSADPPPASCARGNYSIIITGNNKPAGAFCGVTVPAPASGGSNPASGGSNASSNSTSVTTTAAPSGDQSGSVSAAYSPLKTFMTHVVLLIGAAKML